MGLYDKFSPRGASLYAALLFTIGTATWSFGQVDTGSIRGTVRDQSSAVIPGAEATLINEATSYSLVAKTGKDGSYIFTPVKVGNYRINVEYKGFKRAV